MNADPRRATAVVAAVVVVAVSLAVGATWVGAPSTEDALVPSVSEAELAAVGDDGQRQWLVAGSAFHTEAAGATATIMSGGCLDLGAGELAAIDLALPHGTTVTSVQAHVHDDGTGDGSTVRVERYTTPAASGATAPSTTEVFTIASRDGDESGHQTLTDTTPAPDATAAVIDHGQYAYALVLEGGGSSPDLCGVTVTHEVEQADGLVFHHTQPCAAFDTRPGQGGAATPVAGGATATIDLVRSDYSTQGGTADTSGCTLPAAGPDGTVAVLVHLVALEPTSSGNLRLWDADEPEPDGGVLVYGPGRDNGNAVTVGVGDASPGDDGGVVVVRNNGGAAVHVRAVILGYYTAARQDLE